ncbi:MAG: PhoU domain-containing protein [Infirmifilum sp.]
METRRIVRIGSSFYVALPKTWVQERVGGNGIVALTVEEDGSLKITPFSIRKQDEKKQVSLLCSKDLFRNIVSAYLRGFEVIEITMNPECRDDVLRTVERARQLLLGLELVGEEPGLVVLQSFTRPDYDLDSLVQRMSSTTLSMLNLSFRVVETGDLSLAEKILYMDDIVDRLYFLAVRIIRSRISDPSYPSSEKVKLVDTRVVVRNLENLGDLLEEFIRAGVVKGRVDWELYDRLASFQKRVVALALGESIVRENIYEEYLTLEDKLARARVILPPRFYETLEDMKSLLKDILDLS